MANGLLGMFQNPQQNQMQALLGQYYDPRQAAKQQLWGMVRGLGQGLMNQGPSKTPINFGTTLGSAVQGGIEGSDQAVGDYQQKALLEALLGYKMAGEKRDEDWQAKERARKESGWASEDANAAQLNALIGSIQDPQERLFAQLNREAYVKAKLNPGGEGGGYFGTPLPYDMGGGQVGYGLPGRDASFKPLQAPEGAKFLSPHDKAFMDKQGSTEGGVMGDAKATYNSMKSKLPGIKSVMTELRNLAKTATYTVAGKVRDETRKQLGLSASPESIARTSYEAIIANQIIPLLRDTFGAQFTALEGERLQKTVGDPDLTPEQKVANIEAFINQKIRDIEALAVQTGQQGGVDTGTTIPDDPLGLR